MTIFTIKAMKIQNQVTLSVKNVFDLSKLYSLSLLEVIDRSYSPLNPGRISSSESSIVFYPYFSANSVSLAFHSPQKTFAQMMTNTIWQRAATCGPVPNSSVSYH